MNNEVVRHEPGLMELVQQIINSPNAKDQVEVVKAMLDMKERLEDRAAKQAFAEALHDLQSRLPPITKDGTIVVKGVVRSRYATIDQIDDALRPLLDEYGFSFQLSETGITESGMRAFAGTLIHKSGHEKTVITHLPLDTSPFRSAVQSEGATISYARRQLYKQHFNIVERGQDTDGQNVQFISDDEANDLMTMIRDTNANLQKFCDYLSISSLKELKKDELPRALEALKKRAVKMQKKQEAAPAEPETQP